MAWTAASQWELRTTATAANGFGGGGFDASFGGVDYSQQNAPQLTHTDGVISGTNVQSTLGGFTDQMKGNGIFLSGPGVWCQITAFVDGNNVTIDRAPGNSSGNTYNVGGAYLPTSSGFAINYVAGNKLWMGPGTYALISNSLSINQPGTALLPIVIEGYSVVRGDGIPAPVIQFVTSDASAFRFNNIFQILKSVTIDGRTNNSDVVGFANFNCEMIGCKVINGHGNQVNFAANGCKMSRCDLDGTNNTGASGFGQVLVSFGIQGSVIEHCHIHNGPANTHLGAIVDSGDLTVIQNNVIRNHAAHGLRLADFNYGKLIQFNDIWNCGDSGIDLENAGNNFEGLAIKYNIIGKSTNYDIKFGGSDQSAVFGTQEWAKANVLTNAFYTTGTARYHNVPTGTGDIVLTANPFVDDTTTYDFHLNAIAGGGASCLNAVSVVFVDGVNTGTYTVGALGTPVPAVVTTLAAASTAGVAPTIDEVQFPTGISEGATGGAVFQTIVMSAGTGMEARIPIMTHGRYAWNAATGLKSPTDMAAITAFWLARQGRARGFRWKDWDDYQATDSPLTITGKPTAQLSKRYSSGIVNYDRVIYKPVTSTLSIKRGGSAYAAWTVDTTTGVVTWTVINTKAITAITKAASAVVTVGASHGFSAGEVVYFTGVAGMTQINGLVGTISSTAATTITVGIDSSAFSTYTSGGTANKYPQPSDTVLATFQFDVPVRFDTDVMQMTNDSSQIRRWDNLPVIELTGG